MSRTVAAALHAAAIPLREARLLLQHVMGVSHAGLAAHPERLLTAAQQAQYAPLVARREAGEPVAYLLGEREFFGLAFEVTPAVLIPRPETELLVELALAHAADRAPRILDLGTGSGCVAVALATQLPHAQVTAVDAAPAALDVAQRNAARHGVAVRFVHGDWFAPLEGEIFDLIVANPPYVATGDAHLRQGDLRFEPVAALASGADGLDALRRIVAAAPGHLAAGGRLLVEHGYDQAVAVAALLAGAAFVEIGHVEDLAGIPRVSGGRRP